MRSIHWLGLLALSLATVVAGCKSGGSEKKDAAEKEYDVKGKVVAVDAARKSITLDHEEIPGLMKAMKMRLTLADPKLGEGLQPGDVVEGRLRVESGEYIVTQLKKR